LRQNRPHRSATFTSDVLRGRNRKMMTVVARVATSRDFLRVRIAGDFGASLRALDSIIFPLTSFYVDY
jgi:hypothetical protein